MMTAKEREKVSVGGWETVFGFFFLVLVGHAEH
jgi:hypothetical protein